MTPTRVQTGHYRLLGQNVFRGFMPLAPFRLGLVIALWWVIVWPAGAAEGRIPGKFVWAELITDDAALSEKFYGALFDWEFEDHAGYRVAWRGEEPGAGLVQRPRKDPAGKSRWIAYLSVEDMAAATAALADAGARMVADSRQVAGVGELAVYQDPEGALFGIVHGAAR